MCALPLVWIHRIIVFLDRAMYPFKYDYTLEEEMFRGNGDRYAIYHVDEDTPGKQHFFMKMALQSMQQIINVSILADYMKMKSWMICMPYSTIIHRQIIKHILCRSMMLSLQTVVGICRHITWIDLDLRNFQTLQHKEKKYSILSRK